MPQQRETMADWLVRYSGAGADLVEGPQVGISRIKRQPQGPDAETAGALLVPND
jgi:hypothetical protein